MNDSSRLTWRNPWLRRSVTSLVVLALGSLVVGFVWLPSAAADYGVQGLWASICRAAGAPAAWGDGAVGASSAPPATDVVLQRSMAAAGTSDSVGRGATLALACTMCHGTQGRSVSDAPNLAGQYPEVVIKQLHDYRGGQRSSTVMRALARGLSDEQVADLAAYYAWLPKVRNPATSYAEPLPALVSTGAPLRNIAPCTACHGSVDQKLGAPWLEGMPKDYLVAQLLAFQSGARRNDSHAQMRNMVRQMSPGEIAQVAGFYARRAPSENRH